MLYLCTHYSHKKFTIMALETRPIPVLTGQVLIDFLEKVKNFKDDTPREEIQELKRTWFPIMEAADKKEREARMRKMQNG
jgi:hypothetical protein